MNKQSIKSSVMKKAFIYTIRVICAIVGMLAFVMLFGEPTNEVTYLPLFGIKLLCILAIWVVYKVCIHTLPEDKRKEYKNN